MRRWLRRKRYYGQILTHIPRSASARQVQLSLDEVRRHTVWPVTCRPLIQRSGFPVLERSWVPINRPQLKNTQKVCVSQGYPNDLPVARRVTFTFGQGESRSTSAILSMRPDRKFRKRDQPLGTKRTYRLRVAKVRKWHQTDLTARLTMSAPRSKA